MQNSMFLTPSSPVLSRPMGAVKSLLAAAVLVGLLDSGSAVADASDWLPLAVGNSWTYSHDYYESGDGNDDVYSQWTNYTAPYGIPQFTLSVLRTEVIDGKTYFVISDMPEYWPPVPPQFIAGKKLRWVGDQLMERTADGEQALFRFGGTSGASGASGEASYAVTTSEGTLQITSRESRSEHTHDNTFSFRDGAEAAGPSDNWWYWSESESGVTGESGATVGLGAAIIFLKGFGVQQGQMALYDGDAPLFKNIQKAKHAVINGRTVTVEQARAAAGRASSSDASSIEWFSWGLIKQEGRE